MRTLSGVVLLVAVACSGEEPSGSNDAGTDASPTGSVEIGEVSGIERVLYSPSFDRGSLRIHISEVESPGDRLHAPHTHGGQEAFFVLEGTGELTLGDETHVLDTGEAALFDGEILHGLGNAGPGPIRYMVIRNE